ncbi:MAG TPA: 23S rRNA (pseudouridine(1915)-N(3))-methyltransferase RlmH, partial [Nitrospirota bacterium]|nr:23S rRNA (pseudouridine(1915)-N(3))-methyltransferase RlmH [Nitrospirota bacterium]
MKLSIVCMGKTRERFVQEGLAKYLRFLRPFADVEIRELKEEKIQDLKGAPAVRKKEAEKIFKAVRAGALLVALDERGQEFTSHDFARFMNSALEKGVREMAFVLGGAMGLDEAVTGKADKVIAMSRWTLTH